MGDSNEKFEKLQKLNCRWSALPSAIDPMIDITGQVEAAVAVAVRKHTASWRPQSNTAGYAPPQGYHPLPPPSGQHAQGQQLPRQPPRPAVAPAGRTSPPRSDSTFFGVCFNCNNTGHRSAKCPYGPRCYNCWQLGHMTRECPNPRIERPAHIPAPQQRARTPRQKWCQLCDSPGVTLKTCPRCQPTLSAYLGNLYLGSQE